MSQLIFSFVVVTQVITYPHITLLQNFSLVIFSVVHILVIMKIFVPLSWWIISPLFYKYNIFSSSIETHEGVWDHMTILSNDYGKKELH